MKFICKKKPRTQIMHSSVKGIVTVTLPFVNLDNKKGTQRKDRQTGN